MTAYEQKLAALGITNRGQLADGFGGDAVPDMKARKVPVFRGKEAKPPFVMEDLTHLEGARSGGEKLRKQWLKRDAKARARAAGWKRGKGRAERISTTDRHE